MVLQALKLMLTYQLIHFICICICMFATVYPIFSVISVAPVQLDSWNFTVTRIFWCW